jgi:outer membrane receptor protein involved in Fe transport
MRVGPGVRRRAVPQTARALLAVGTLAASVTVGAPAGASTGSLPDVVVTAPLPGADAAAAEVPANVQRLNADRFDRGRAHSVAEALSQLGASVTLNDTQGNPFQPDLNFRGFAGSPVLGTPQGVSVFVDGVRVNEVFGDAVNWELVPQAAIAAVEVSPGSNPVFGLNTLGGAIVVTTRRGSDAPGVRLETEGGSFGRRVASAAAGAAGERLDGFLAGETFDDDGWGDHNPSRVRQLFAKAGYRAGVHEVTASATYAHGDLSGNQTLPRSWLSTPRESYTWPDVQRNEMVRLDLAASHRLGDGWTLTEQAYYRRVRTAIANSNVSDAFDPGAPAGPGNAPTGNLFEHLDQERPGLAVQVAGRGRVGGRANALVAGLAVERGTSRFLQFDQPAGAARDTSSDAPTELKTSLGATTRTVGAYVSDTIALAARSFANLAARYDEARVALDDRLGTSLDGRHAFRRLNPAVGLTHGVGRGLTLYVRYEEGMRTPTPVELTCADPQAPCTLPNAFAADPPLRAVLARTFEAGARGPLGEHAAFTAAAFSTQLDDDIQFVSSGGVGVNAGYFRNVGRTRRRGLELALDAAAGGLSVAARYTLLDATFRTPLVLASPDNSTASALGCPTCLEIAVRPGDRIPGVPRQVAKLELRYARGPWGAGLTATGQSGTYARGDENNLDANGPLPGYAVVGLDGYRELGRRWRVFVRADNVFDRRFYTFGLLGRNAFTGPGRTFDPSGEGRPEQFRTVGAPRGLWVGVSYRTAGSDPR